MSKSRQSITKAIADRKQESTAMHAEYVAHRNTESGAADYAWETSERLDKEVERLEAELAEMS
jgi:hypothetical protein